jgi:predicted outer membrane repeat protein
MKHILNRIVCCIGSDVLVKLVKPFRLAAALSLAATLALPGANATHAEPDAPNAGVVGTGTAASCTEAALTSALAGGGTITFNCGGPAMIFVVSQKTITQPTTIDGGGVITLTGGLTSKLFQSMPGVRLDLRNITLDSAFSLDDDGAAIRALGPLVLTNVTVQNSIAGALTQQSPARYCGGAIFVAGAATIRDSTFHRNTALFGGAAICARAPQFDTVTVHDSVFTDNKSTHFNGNEFVGEGMGGAILVDARSRMSVNDSSFSGNSGRLGGAVYVGPSASLEMRGTPTDTLFTSKLRFSSNDARDHGGAIYNTGALSMSYALLTQNGVPMQDKATNSGGAIYNAGVMTLTHALLSQNASDYGGGMYVGKKVGPGAAQALIEHTSFIRNTSTDLGGGLYAEALTTTVTISNSAFHRNSAAIAGGGVSNFDAKLSIFNSSFTGNQAEFGGGGLYVHSTQVAAPTIPVHSSTFSGNTTGSNISGGILVYGANIELFNATIVGNGSGLFADNGGGVRLRNTVLHNPNAFNCVVTGAATISDDGNNVSTDTSCPLSAPSSQTGSTLDPALGPLTVDALGPTSYHKPLEGSLLINKGANCPPRDQLGMARAGECDIGAVEFGGTPPTPPTPPVTPMPPVTPTPPVTPAPPTPAPNGRSVYLPVVVR